MISSVMSSRGYYSVLKPGFGFTNGFHLSAMKIQILAKVRAPALMCSKQMANTTMLNLGSPANGRTTASEQFKL